MLRVNLTTEEFAALWKIDDPENNLHVQLKNPKVRFGTCICDSKPFVLNDHLEKCIYSKNAFRCFCVYCTGQQEDYTQCPNGGTKTYKMIVDENGLLVVVNEREIEKKRHRHVWTPEYESKLWKCSGCGDTCHTVKEGVTIEEIAERKKPKIVVVEKEEEDEEVYIPRQQNKRKRPAAASSRRC